MAEARVCGSPARVQESRGAEQRLVGGEAAAAPANHTGHPEVAPPADRCDQLGAPCGFGAGKAESLGAVGAGPKRE